MGSPSLTADTCLCLWCASAMVQTSTTPMLIKTNGKVQQNQVRHHVTWLKCLTHSTPSFAEGTPLTGLLQSVAQPESTCGLCSGHRASEDGQPVWLHQRTPAVLRRKPQESYGSTPHAWRRSGGLKIEVRNVIVAQLHYPCHMLLLTDTCGGYSINLLHHATLLLSTSTGQTFPHKHVRWDYANYRWGSLIELFHLDWLKNVWWRARCY